MNTKMKKILSGALSLLVFVALIAFAPISRIAYSIYDTNRTNEILAQLEQQENETPEGPVVNEFHKQAYYTMEQTTEGDKTIDTIHLLVLTSDSVYEIVFYERTASGDSAYTSDYFRMRGTYTREGNVLTVTPGIGVIATSPDGVSYTYLNAQYVTAEEAGGDKTRDEIYDMRYDSRQIALMKDGTFVVGGESDSEEELGAPEGRKVYTTAVLQGRVTYKTLVTLDNGIYFVYSQSTNSNNAEQTTGALFGYGSYVINDNGKAIAPDEAKPEETYDIVVGEPGIGYTYANNNGSHMHFDLQTEAQFSQWLATSFNAATPTFYVSESGFTIKVGALKTLVEPWGLYIPAADSDDKDDEPTEPAVESIKLEIETSAEGKPFILQFNADGTLLTGWTNYEQTMLDGTWRFIDGALTLNMGYEYTVAENAEGGLDVTVNYGQMGEKTYTIAADVVDAMKAIELPADRVRLEIETSAEGKPFILEMNANGALLTGWTNYEQTMQEGTWTISGKDLVLTMEYEYTVAENAEGGLDVTVNYGQMGEKTYTITADQISTLQSIAPAPESVKAEITSSVEGKPFILELNADGTLLTGWTNYEQTLQTGAWSFAGGKLELAMGYESTIAANAEGGLDVTVNYGQMGEKTYTFTADQVSALQTIAPAPESVKAELETSTEGKPFILELKADGTMVTGWTNYEQTLLSGTWYISGDSLVLNVGYASASVKNAEGGLDVTVNYGQMGEKIYTFTAVQLASLKNISPVPSVKAEVATSTEGKPFVLELKADGTMITGWTNYEQTLLTGSWYVSDDSLVLLVGYESTMTENAEGGLDVTVNYGQMGEKTYTFTADQVAALKGFDPTVGVKLEIETSAEGKPFVLDLKSDGTLVTGWTNYEQTMVTGTWTVTDGALVLTMDYEYTVAENAEGGLDVTVNYGQMGEKTYTLTADQAKAILNQG